MSKAVQNPGEAAEALKEKMGFDNEIKAREKEIRELEKSIEMTKLFINNKKTIKDWVVRFLDAHTPHVTATLDYSGSDLEKIRFAQGMKEMLRNLKTATRVTQETLDTLSETLDINKASLQIRLSEGVSSAV